MDSLKRKREELKLEEKRLEKEISDNALEISKQHVLSKTVDYIPFLKKFFENDVESLTVASQSFVESTMKNNQGGGRDKIDFFEVTLKSSPWKIVGHYQHHYYSASTYIFLMQKGKDNVSLESGMSYDLYVLEKEKEGEDIFKTDRETLKEVLNIECGVHVDMFLTALRSFIFNFLEHKKAGLGKEGDILDSEILFKIFAKTIRQ